MKLTVIGGGGVRTPFLVKSLVEKLYGLGIKEIALLDTDANKLEIFGKMAKRIAGMVNSEISVSITTAPDEALSNADFVITTVRVGGNDGRILDERIALSHGVLGQETTGAGGFAMAMRSIPALMDYMQMIKRYSKPGCMVFNFTNPAGLVTQALRSEGYDNVYGICDGPSEFIKELEKLLGVKHGKLEVECYGLNHLSWFRKVLLDGKDILPELLDNPRLYKETEMRFFDKDLVKWSGKLFNGYLHYYYSREKAIENIIKAGKTRGETIKEISVEMMEALRGIDVDTDFEKAYEIFIHYYNKREASYMAIESGTVREEIKKLDLGSLLAEKEDDGYAGVAINFIEGYLSDRQKKMVLIVPNSGAIEGLSDEDTIEVSCTIDKNGATPVRIGRPDDFEMNLISQIKLFERLTVKAIKSRSRADAYAALSIHPLVNSYSLAKLLVNEYIEAHKEYVGEWGN